MLLIHFLYVHEDSLLRQSICVEILTKDQY